MVMGEVHSLLGHGVGRGEVGRLEVGGGRVAEPVGRGRREGTAGCRGTELVQAMSPDQVSAFLKNIEKEKY